MYRSTKRYGHDLGLSAVFRQWRATSHCNQLHGYALGFRFEFGCTTLDENGWVVDFGSLKPLKDMLVSMFDHKLVIASDDPQRPVFEHLQAIKLADVVVHKRVGCEAFAQVAYEFADVALRMLPDHFERGLCVVSAECMEHGANSAIYIGDNE